MSNESWKREIAFEEQGAWDTIAPGTDPEVLRFYEGDDIWMTPEIIELSGTESTRDMVEYAPGNFDVRGRRITNIEMVADRSRKLLTGLFGTETGTNPYTYTPANLLPDYTIWKRCGDVYLAVVGVKIQSAEFAFALGTLKITTEIRARHIEEIAQVSFPTLTHSNKRPFMFWALSVTYGGNPVDIKEGSLRYENGLPDTDYYSGSRYTGEHTEGVRLIEGSLTVTFDDYAKVTDFIASTEKALVLSVQSSHGDILAITIPRIVHTEDMAISESENLWRIAMPWRAYKLDGQNLITAVLTTV